MAMTPWSYDHMLGNSALQQVVVICGHMTMICNFFLLISEKKTPQFRWMDSLINCEVCLKTGEKKGQKIISITSMGAFFLWPQQITPIIPSYGHKLRTPWMRLFMASTIVDFLPHVKIIVNPCPEKKLLKTLLSSCPASFVSGPGKKAILKLDKILIQIHLDWLTIWALFKVKSTLESCLPPTHTFEADTSCLTYQRNSSLMY